MNHGLIPNDIEVDEKAVVKLSRNVQKSSGCAALMNIWKILKFTIRHKWSVFVSCILFLQFLPLLKIIITQTPMERALDDPNIFEEELSSFVNKITFTRLLQCKKIICRKNTCFCSRVRFVSWYTANESCNSLVPGHSSLIINENAISRLGSTSKKQKNSFWVGAFVNYKRNCVWLNGESFCNRSSILNINKCLYMHNRRCYLSDCNSAHDIYPLCYTKSRDHWDHSCTNKYCYGVERISVKNWKEANTICRESGYIGMAYFIDANEQNFLLSMHPMINIMIGAISRKEGQIEWLFGKKGIPSKDIIIYHQQPLGCYYSEKNKMKEDANCDDVRQYACQVTLPHPITKYKRVSLKLLQNTRNLFNIRLCAVYFCNEQYKKCYCITRIKTKWGYCSSLLGSGWQLNIVNTDEEYNTLINHIGDYSDKLWIGYTNFINTNRPRWLDGTASIIESRLLVQFLKYPSCFYLCYMYEIKYCSHNCYSDEHLGSICSIGIEDFFEKMGI